MKKHKIAVLDDYQNVALENADWSVLHDRADITVFQDPLVDPDAVIESWSLLTSFVSCVSGHRCLDNVIERLSISSSLTRRGLETSRSMWLDAH